MNILFFGAGDCGVPALFALAGLLQQSFCTTDEARWLLAKNGALAALALSIFCLFPSDGGLARSLMMLLVTTLATVLCWFSATYLKGIPKQSRFLSSFLFTLASVGVLVATAHLGVLVVALVWHKFFSALPAHSLRQSSLCPIGGA